MTTNTGPSEIPEICNENFQLEEFEKVNVWPDAGKEKGQRGADAGTQ